ncbi:hypothetical protein [Marinibacterium sp. SX1]|uniref:hypothetical protein n=1 Tax=Marinibacterium sp. SX1 TaxID=3388424 RepID=UPI003D17CC5D
MAFVTTSTPRTGLGHTLLWPVRVLARAMDWIRECNRMGSEYVQLSHKTDARLAKLGLTRQDIPADVLRRSALF